MKPSRIPLLLRRLIGPLLLLALVLGVVYLFTVLGTLSPEMRDRYAPMAIGFALALVIARVLDYLFFDIAFQLRRNVVAPALLRQLVALVIFGVGVALVVKRYYPDVNLGAVLTTSAILTAVIGLALQDTLGNLFAGLALHLERTVQVGDMVHSGEKIGTVEELSWRAIKLRTMEGNLLLVPNSVAGRERLEVFRRPGPPIARFLHVGLEYDATPGNVREVLLEAMRNLPGVASFPEPAVYLKSFDGYAVTYEVRYWLEDYAQFLQLDSSARERVWYALERAGLKIAYPVIRQHQYAAGPLLHPSRSEEIVGVVDGVDLFAALAPEDRRHIALGARERLYAPGEVIVREGDSTSSMFVIEAGRAGVSIHPTGRESRKLAVLEPGDSFGEISLLTGEPRSATVRALTETRLIEIDKATLGPILERTPTLCETLDSTVQKRRRQAADMIEASRLEMPKPEDQIPLAERIARFFGLGVGA